jgi:hypothetical protein
MRAGEPDRTMRPTNNIASDEASYAAARREQPRWAWWLCGTGLAAAVLVAASVLSPWVRHEWALSLFRQNTPYTQLGFDNASALPVTAVSD